MKYNYWKLMDKVDVIINNNRTDFDAYVVEHGDKRALENAKKWATRYYGNDGKDYTLHTFDNEGFTVTIDSAAGGSSQGGRLSFWGVIVEKDGIKFKTSINSDILVDLIKDTTIVNGIVKDKLLFARRAGTQGLLHKGMKLYTEAADDMAHKKTMQIAKKTTKWEIGGVYKTITQTDVCLGEVWDTMEEYEIDNPRSYHRNLAKLRKRETPVKTLIWTYIYGSEEDSISFTKVLEDKNGRDYAYIVAGKPPARAKTEQLEVKESDLKIIDQILAKVEYGDYGERIKGRYVREIK